MTTPRRATGCYSFEHAGLERCFRGEVSFERCFRVEVSLEFPEGSLVVGALRAQRLDLVHEAKRCNMTLSCTSAALGYTEQHS